MANWEKPFISYARKDQAFALRLANDLRKHGKTVWIDTSLQSGQAWAQKLDEGLEASDVVLLVVSRTSRKSEWVNKELHTAQDDLKKPVIPVIYKRYGSWSPIADLQKIDFIGWYDEGLAKLLELPLPSRPWWRRILIQLNHHGVQLLLILIALIAALIAYRYYFSTSDTHWRLAGSDASAIVLLVENRGGRSSTLLGGTFAMQFGGLPLEPVGLVPVGPAKAIRIPGHKRVRVPLTFADILMPRHECDGERCTKEQAFPLIPNAAIVVTGKVRESDDRVAPRQDKVNGARVQKFIETHYPEVPES
jgi:TIR domain